MKLKPWHGALLGVTLPVGAIALAFAVMEALNRSGYYIPAIYGVMVLSIAFVVIGLTIAGVCGYQNVKAKLDQRTREGKTQPTENDPIQRR